MQYIIDDTLEEMAIEGRSHFSPLYVCNRANIDNLKIVTEYLMRLVHNEQKIKVNYEVECPDGDSDFALISPLELKQEIRECHICGRSYTPSLDRIWVSFDFLPEYKAHVKKKCFYQTNQNHRHLAIM